MNSLTVELRTKGLPEGASVASYSESLTTNEAEASVLSLTSNSGYSDAYSDIYSGPSSVATLNRLILIIPSDTNTQRLWVSDSSTEWGVPLSSRGASVLETNSSKLYISTTGTTNVEVQVIAL